MVDVIRAILCLVVYSMKPQGEAQHVVFFVVVVWLVDFLILLFCLFVICFFYGVILLFHFRLKTPYWSSFAVVSCVVFNLGCCVFTQYNLLVGYPGWILIQHRTQVRDYSLTGLTGNINLIIGISHLSISGIVVHGRCYIFHCFYFSVFA